MPRTPFALLLLLSGLSLAIAHGRRLRGRRPRLITINPPKLLDPTPLGYSHIALDTRTFVAHVAGQVALNRTLGLVGTTLTEQLVEVKRNLLLALDAVDASVEDILRLKTFVVNFDPDTDLTPIGEFGIGFGSPPGTLVSTPSLALKGLLVEIELDVAVSKAAVTKIVRKHLRSVSRKEYLDEEL